MKQIKGFLLIALIIIISAGRSQAQNADRYMMFTVHEDDVLPSMVGEYEKIAKEFMDNVKKYNIPGVKWITTQTNDFRYLYVRPISKMADLDDNKFWMTLSEKMGADKLTDLFNRMDKCYNEHVDYILRLDKDLSYMPGGITQTPAGKDYRRFYYIYTTPQNQSKLAEDMKAVKDMFQKKGSKMEYRVYKSGFGAKGDFYMVAIAAKDGEEYEAMDAANTKLIGSDGDELFGKMMKNVSEWKEVTGRMRPDLAYSAN
jgi:hypothetical protein